MNNFLSFIILCKAVCGTLLVNVTKNRQCTWEIFGFLHWGLKSEVVSHSLPLCGLFFLPNVKLFCTSSCISRNDVAWMRVCEYVRVFCRLEGYQVVDCLLFWPNFCHLWIVIPVSFKLLSLYCADWRCPAWFLTIFNPSKYPTWISPYFTQSVSFMYTAVLYFWRRQLYINGTLGDWLNQPRTLQCLHASAFVYSHEVWQRHKDSVQVTLIVPEGTDTSFRERPAFQRLAEVGATVLTKLLVSIESCPSFISAQGRCCVC